ncbi:MAG: hydrogenase [Betaproteobacteria bacterium CG2_30_59_46]|nr:MAG: hydrogenase [Betaproteobacteria bacterium CG2_30_59_46]PIQ12777.1 MAG: Ni,Fe-hydrogenase III large subunit [Hydrogenophilales bacterium CG18_big_fil_WC_8_21_14_2_50_58_12]PIX99120.1 MAG: Ni,Fe-hydrogenase III large subunit [Hydrogenophilales bacterium CG_4_10_14_3_um_filter_58_23]PJB05473.1 MAG: Ni,Fe-hydrogenase III large subunit [Hydrogenophilales bacterium CG_4_9_14_3_um_filter_59_35]
MRLDEFPTKFPKLPGAMPIWHGAVDAATFRSLCEQVGHGGGKLVALWGSDELARDAGYALHVSLITAIGMLCLTLPVNAERPSYPDLSDLFPGASRMQRAAFDLLGLFADGACDHRKWMRHASWPGSVHPLRKSFDGGSAFATETDGYPFVTVTGGGVHEIAVGPVHAGTIEPGHFRFSVIGERVLRLEERFGYTHKGIEKRFESMNLDEGAKLAGRISGDSTVAYAWAYAQAVESVTGATPSPRALALRAVLLELERIHNHLGDLGNLGNDVGLAFGFAQFWILKEDLLRLNHDLFGHRYLMDSVVPGGVARDLDGKGCQRILEALAHLQHEVGTLKDIYDEHAGAQDRFLSAGRVSPDRAALLGLTGLAGRASSQAWDLRAQFPCAPYDQLDVRMATHHKGDVAARVTMRFEEVQESIRLIRLLLDQLPPGEPCTAVGNAPENALGIGWVEGWRGEIMVALHTGKDNRIHRLHPHDPSWQNWPVLEHAIIDNIVPDFPLINKSFNLSYTGIDL